ncbi:MAG: hypothetical protein WCF03_05105, partial [Nitrososphaeraceae archaeon]
EYHLRSSQNSQHPICDILAISCASIFCTLNAILMVTPKSLEQLLPLYLQVSGGGDLHPVVESKFYFF